MTQDSSLLTPPPSATFCGAKVADIEQLNGDDVAIVGVGWDDTCTNRLGTRNGPRGVREASAELGTRLLSDPDEVFTDLATGRRIAPRDAARLRDLGDVVTFAGDVPRTSDAITDVLRRVSERGAFPLSIGGDHYVSFPLFRGYAEGARERGATRIGYIQIDHHLDLIDRDPIWGTHWHGTNARRIAELPGISRRNMCWIGTGGYTRLEGYEFARAGGGQIFPMSDVRAHGIAEITRRAIEIASDGTDVIYVTLDIDAVDGAYAPGTGAPTIDGITGLDLLEACTLLSGAALGAVDIVEVEPGNDRAGVTCALAARALLEIILPRIARPALPTEARSRHLEEEKDTP